MRGFLSRQMHLSLSWVLIQARWSARSASGFKQKRAQVHDWISQDSGLQYQEEAGQIYLCSTVKSPFYLGWAGMVINRLDNS